MEEPIDETYFNWLCAKVLDVHSQNYWQLMRILACTEFVWIIAGDKNRSEDGLELRDEFLREAGVDCQEAWYHEPCSILEMLISFSRRAAFQLPPTALDWFWIFMGNLRLDDYRRVNKTETSIIESILQTFIWRTYHPDGRGGMFPMRNTINDQRKVEIWYQFCEYLDDQGLLTNLL